MRARVGRSASTGPLNSGGSDCSLVRLRLRLRDRVGLGVGVGVGVGVG